ncbi:MAG: diguanylate cyclase, partial [Bacteroidales bacterium]|nr:diguanylate cyclase [Bacteroidales bacterium]
AWFYTLVEQGRDFHLNVNSDTKLGVTKLWVDMLLRDGDRVLGVVGTGMELEGFLEDIVDLHQPGITSLFVDHDGAIQLHRDPDIIEYASIIKPEGQKHTLKGLLERESDRQRINAMMAALRDSGSAEAMVISDFVMKDDRRYLAGIVYMPAIDWYEVILLDLAVLMPIDGFTPVAVAFTLSLLIALLAMHLALRRYVLRPVQSLEQAMIDMADGHPAPLRLPCGGDEMGRLANHFRAMSTAIVNHTCDLENKVRERTEALHRLASIDALTGLFNRRGMTDLLTREVTRKEGGSGQFGVLLCDLDHFKMLNDSQGHVAGDNALCEVARLLADSIRSDDEAARWGGDEFLVLLAPCDDSTLTVIAERIRTLIEKQLALLGMPLTVSIGAFLTVRGDTVETILQQVDEALYDAKNGGRNRVRVASVGAGMN